MKNSTRAASVATFLRSALYLTKQSGGAGKFLCINKSGAHAQTASVSVKSEDQFAAVFTTRYARTNGNWRKSLGTDKCIEWRRIHKFKAHGTGVAEESETEDIVAAPRVDEGDNGGAAGGSMRSDERHAELVKAQQARLEGVGMGIVSEGTYVPSGLKCPTQSSSCYIGW